MITNITNTCKIFIIVLLFLLQARPDYPMGFMGTGPGAHFHLGPNKHQRLREKEKKKTKDMIFVGLISWGANGEFKLHTVKAGSTLAYAHRFTGFGNRVGPPCSQRGLFSVPPTASRHVKCAGGRQRCWKPTRHPIQRLQKVTHRTGVKLVSGWIFGRYSLGFSQILLRFTRSEQQEDGQLTSRASRWTAGNWLRGRHLIS